jgi:hypothetical protein
MVFTHFIGVAFLSSTIQTMLFKYVSQEESICFKDINTVYITHERTQFKGANLHEFFIKQ